MVMGEDEIDASEFTRMDGVKINSFLCHLFVSVMRNAEITLI